MQRGERPTPEQRARLDDHLSEHDTAADQSPEHVQAIWNRAADIRDAEESQTAVNKSPRPNRPAANSSTEVELSHVRAHIDSLPGEEFSRQEPEYIEVNEQEQALNQSLEFARGLSDTLRHAVPDRERQRALRDLVAIIDNQLQEERALLKDPHYQRQLRPTDQQQFRRAFEYLNRTTRTVDASPVIDISKAG